ncbi:hypothetical protein DITRI_Ditri16bG0081300 [Diplodiscus trichospermus]
MDIEAKKQTGEITQALVMADALGKTINKKSKTQLEDFTNGLKEFDMEHYDDEDNSIELFSKGFGDLYYPSNEMDPYFKDQDVRMRTSILWPGFITSLASDARDIFRMMIQKRLRT